MTTTDRHPSVSAAGLTPPAKATADDASTRSQAKARLGAGAAREQFRIRRFDADRTDEERTFDAAISSKPGRRQLLWIDIAGDLSSSEAEILAGRFKLDPRTRRVLQTAGGHPHLALSGGYFHLRVAAEHEHADPATTKWLDVIACRNVVISQHRAPIRFLDDLDDRIEADTTLVTSTRRRLLRQCSTRRLPAISTRPTRLRT